MTLVAGALFGLVLGRDHRVVRLGDRRDAGVPRLALRAARLGAAPVRRQARSRSTTASRRKARSTSSRCAWCRCSRSSLVNLLMGLTPIRTLDVLLGEPARHARRHDRLRVRRHAARRSSAISAGPASLAFVLLGIFPLVAKRVLDAHQGAQGLREVAASPARFDRNLVVIGAGSRRAGLGLHRRGGEGEGGAGREAQDGRRLPQHRLRAVEGADPLGEAAVADRGARRTTA